MPADRETLLSLADRLERADEALDQVVARAIGAMIRWPNHVQRARHVRRAMAEHLRHGSLPPVPSIAPGAAP